MTRSSSVARVEAFAMTRFGLFTADDAARHGVTRAMLTHHSRTGARWRRVLPTVYQLSDQPFDWRQPLLAALLWAGADAVLSHTAAAALLGLDGIRESRAELWVQRKPLPCGPVVHRGLVEKGDTVRTGLLRHTGLVRTVLDLATVVDDDTLELVVESAIRRDARCESALIAIAQHSRKGRRRLQRVLDRRVPGSPATDSELETRYVQVIRAVDVPAPVRQHRVLGDDGRCIARLDLCWPDVGLWVELDGRSTHDTPRALLADRHRQNLVATRLQWLPLRFTWDDVVLRPLDTAGITEASYRRRGAGRSSL